MASQLVLISVIFGLFLCQLAVQAKTIPCDNPVNCLVDPCRGATCNNYPQAKCRSNYCGGCNKDFYVGCKKVDCGNGVTIAGGNGYR